jgi:hypothetical protein
MPDQQGPTTTSAYVNRLRFRWGGHAAISGACWDWCIAIGASLACIAVQSNVYLNHDVGWVLYSSGLMLDGKVFSRDIIEANPPLIYYLNLPPALAAKITGIQSATAFRLYIIGLVNFCLVLCWRAMHSCEGTRQNVPLRGFIATAAISWLVLPGREFGQREHLALFLTTPYLLVTAAQLSGEQKSRYLRFTCATFAAIGYSLKPYFLVVPLLVESYSFLTTKPLRSRPRLELLTMLGVGALYAVSIPVVAPDYMSKIIPMFRMIYWGFNTRFIVVVAQILPDLMFMPILLVLVWQTGGRPRHIQMLLGFATYGFLISYLVQMKGYAYHAYAFEGFMLLWLLVNVCALFASYKKPSATSASLPWRLIGAVSFTLPLLVDGIQVKNWYGDANITSGRLGNQTTDIINLVNRYASNAYFTALSTHPYPGFPIANQSLAQWGSRTNSHFMIPAIAKLRQGGIEPITRAQQSEIERSAHQFVIEDFNRFDPTIILVDARSVRHALQDSSFDILRFYLEDPRFERIWSEYEELPPLHGFRVFVKLTAQQR